ncbi:hypothetical protein KM043_004676 [Ampulex compressa]|nr:hypothetical protein KM043_004676 [Ampulex compressa]
MRRLEMQLMARAEGSEDADTASGIDKRPERINGAPGLSSHSNARGTSNLSRTNRLRCWMRETTLDELAAQQPQAIRYTGTYYRTLSIKCPGDSVPNNSGGCKCAAKCLAHVCPPGQRLVQVRPANPETPGSCCPRYNCVSADSFGNDICPEDSIPTEDGVCKCVPCLPPSCKFGQRSVQVRPAIPGTPGSCCPLYDCRPSESVSWVKTPPEKGKDAGYCIYKGVARKIGEKWNDSQCVNCVCEEDGESCQTTMCKSCENPIPPDPDECCPHCPLMTNVTLVDPGVSCPLSLDDCDLKCDHGYVNDEHDCPICECAKHKLTDTVVSSSPTIETCPDLSHCGPDCEHVKNERGCLVCSCKSSDSSKTSVNKSIAMVDNNNNKICPEVRCDLHCEHGLVMDENDCTFCECKTPNADCPPLVGCKKRCNFGYKTNKRDCPICRCRVMCMDHENKMHPEGTVWHPSSCVTCNCEIGGRLNCKETICSVACNNPLPPKSGTCCPTCPITTVKEDGAQPGMRGWGPVPIMLIVILALLCLLLIVYIVRSRLRGRLSPSEVSYSSYPPQYYKCVPAYDTPMHRNEKIVPL